MKKYGWELKVIVDGWSEDNYAIKYFCKSLTGYMRKYISQLYSGKHIQCTNCGVLIKPTSNRQKYCPTCWKEKHQELKNKWKRENWNGKGRSLETPSQPL